MITIIIPVSPLTKSVLQKEYNSDIITPRKLDLLFQQLCYRHLSRNNLIKIRKLLTTTISISIPKTLWKEIKNDAHQIGYHLYLFHYHLLINYADAQVDAGVDIIKALNYFMQKYDISEDEFMLETAYRAYFRRRTLRKKRKAILHKKQSYPQIVVKIPDTL